MRLQEKTVLITAAGQGIGYASALAMAAEGASVLATDINSELLSRFDGLPNIQTALLDVMDKDAITTVVEKIVRIDVLFNCAGYVHAGNVLEATDSDWSFAFDFSG